MFKIVQKFGMIECKLVNVPLTRHFILSKSQCLSSEFKILKMKNIPYANVIGTIVYSMISTRPDFAYFISLLNRFMSNPRKIHWEALKYVLKYINSSLSAGLNFEKRCNTLDLVEFVDSDFAGDKNFRKSTITFFFTLGSNCISWKS